MIGIGAMAQRPWQQKATINGKPKRQMWAPKGKWGTKRQNGAPKGKWGNGVSLWDRQCTQDKAMKPIESGNEPVALSQMKGKEPVALKPIESGNEPAALKPIEMAMNPRH
jgi:hypothetical protein